MSDPDFFTGRTVAIAGLGLMGGSLALAFRRLGAEILAYDPSPQAVSLALEIGAVSRASSRLDDILPDADVILLCAPVRAILELLRTLPDLHPGNALVIDIGSTKLQICRSMDRLPSRFSAVGGHPMCGAAAAGIAHARADLFEGAPFALTSTARTTQAARDLVETLVLALHARPLWLDAGVHDRWVASTSHLPYLISLALALATPEEAAPLVGPGFRSSSRLAASSLSMMLDTLMTNPGHVLDAVQRFRLELDGIESLLQAGDEARLREKMAYGSIRLAQLVGSLSGD